MENVVLCHPDKEETELDDIPGNRTAPTTEKEDSDREWAVVGSDDYIRYGLK